VGVVTKQFILAGALGEFVQDEFNRNSRPSDYRFSQHNCWIDLDTVRRHFNPFRKS
jgi:hypothetical protein